MVVGEIQTGKEIGYRRKDVGSLTDRARANQHRQERKDETHRDKRIRMAKGEDVTRIVSEKPGQMIRGGEWEMLPQKEDTTARRLIGGQDDPGRETYKVFKDEMKELAHEEEYAERPILRLVTRQEEMENGTIVHEHVKGRHWTYERGEREKLTYNALQVVMALHQRHTFHLAVATDGAKKEGTKDRK
eukprot:6182867-Pleurochrysis_carterae.AAC.4